MKKIIFIFILYFLTIQTGFSSTYTVNINFKPKDITFNSIDKLAVIEIPYDPINKLLSVSLPSSGNNDTVIKIKQPLCDNQRITVYQAAHCPVTSDSPSTILVLEDITPSTSFWGAVTFISAGILVLIGTFVFSAT